MFGACCGGAHPFLCCGKVCFPVRAPLLKNIRHILHSTDDQSDAPHVYTGTGMQRRMPPVQGIENGFGMILKADRQITHAVLQDVVFRSRCVDLGLVGGSR